MFCVIEALQDIFFHKSELFILYKDNKIILKKLKINK